MPGFLAQYDGSEELDLSDLVSAPPATWNVTLRKSLTNKQLYRAKQNLSRIVNGKAAPDIAAYQLEMTVASIIDWNLTDAADRPLSVFPDEDKRKSVSSLPEQVFSKILARVQELNKDRSEDEDATFQVDDPDGLDTGANVEPDASEVLAAVPSL